MVLVCSVVGCAAAGLSPVIKNAGFEDTGAGIPSWEWWPGSGATCGVSTNNPHSGARCLEFSNGVETPILESFGRFQQSFGLRPGTKYELSVWVRGEDVKPDNYFNDWGDLRLDIPAGTYGWKKISKVFYSHNWQNYMNFGLNVTGPAKSFAVDDIQIRAVGTPFGGNGLEGSYTMPGTVDKDGEATPISVSVASSLPSSARIEAAITAGSKSVFNTNAEVAPGTNVFNWKWNSGRLAARNLTFSLRVIDANGKCPRIGHPGLREGQQNSSARGDRCVGEAFEWRVRRPACQVQIKGHLYRLSGSDADDD